MRYSHANIFTSGGKIAIYNNELQPLFETELIDTYTSTQVRQLSKIQNVVPIKSIHYSANK